MAEEVKTETYTNTKEISYTYWVDKNNKSRQLPEQHKPIKLKKPINQNITSEGRSAWNNCGTWEQKKISIKQLQEIVNKSLIQYLNSSDEGKSMKLSKVDLNGQINKVYSRNKTNLLYEIKGKIQFENSQEKKVTLKLKEFTDQGDRDYELKGGQHSPWIKSNTENIIKIIEKLINKFKQ